MNAKRTAPAKGRTDDLLMARFDSLPRVEQAAAIAAVNAYLASEAGRREFGDVLARSVKSGRV